MVNTNEGAVTLNLAESLLMFASESCGCEGEPGTQTQLLFPVWANLKQTKRFEEFKTISKTYFHFRNELFKITFLSQLKIQCDSSEVDTVDYAL